MGVDLGECGLIEPWGEGASATVWRAIHRPTGAPCAVKILRADRRLDELARRQFRREVRAVAGLDHPHVARVYDQGSVDASAAAALPEALTEGAPYLVFEALRGGPLGRWRGRLPWPRLRDIVCDLLRGLAHAHSRGVIHLDLKPSNVLLDGPADRPGTRAVLTDFGIAQIYRRPGEDDTSPRDAYLGTPQYSPPEQILGPAADAGPWTDLYALGCLVWAMTTGSPPFRGSTSVATLHLHLRGQLPAFEPVVAVPAGLGEWLARCVAREIEGRFQRAAGALRAWRELDPGAPPTAAVRLPVDALTRGSSLFALRSAPLVGREEEVAQLEDALEDLEREGGVRFVLLRGQAGAGKTRLARHLCELAVESGRADVLRAQHGPTPSPVHGLGSALDQHLRTAGVTDDLDRRLAAHLDRLQLDGVQPILLEELRPGTLDAPPAGRERRGALAAVLAALSREHPLILWLDDLQWGPRSARLLHRLLRTDGRILVVGTACDDLLRSGSPIANALSMALADPPHTELVVAPLNRADATKLVRQLLFLDLDLASALAKRSGGNPLFATQLVSSLVDSGSHRSSGDGYRLSADATPTLPVNIRRLWLGRIDGVLRGRADWLEAVELAAALGLRVELDEWQLACTQAGIRPPLHLLGLLSQRGVLQERVYDFRFEHGLARDAVEERAREQGRWRQLCSSCADALADRRRPGDTERRAELLLQAGRAADAFPLAVAAARDAAVRGEHEDASRWIETAQACLDEATAAAADERWSQLGLARVLALRLRSEYAAAREGAERVTRRASRHGHRRSLAEALHVEGVMSRMVRRPHDEVVALLAQAIAAWQVLGAPEEHADALCSLGQAWSLHATLAPQADRAYDEAEVVLGDRPALGIRTRLSRLRGTLAYRRGDLDVSRQRLLEALPDAQRTGRLHAEARIRNDLAYTALAAGELEEAERQGVAMLALADRAEHPADRNDGLVLLGQVLARAGRLDEAEATLATALAEVRLRNSGWVVVALATLGEFYVARQRYGDADPLVQELQEVESSAPLRTFGLVLLVCTHVGLERWSAASEALEVLLAGDGRAPDVDDLRQSLNRAAAEAEAAGRPELARTLLDGAARLRLP